MHWPIAVLALAACSPRLGTPDRPVRLVVAPSEDRAGLEGAVGALAAALSDASGLAVTADVPERYADVVLALGEGRADVAITTVMTYLLARDAYGAQALLAVERDGATEYRGAIFVPADRGWTDLAALQGAKVAYVDLYSVSGYVAPAVLLEAADVHPAELIAAGSHHEVVRRVYLGQADAGFAYHDARDELDVDDVHGRVAVLATTDAIPNEPVVARNGLPDDVREAIVRGLTTLAGSEEGLRALGAVHGITGLRPVDDAAYDPVRDALTGLGKRVDEMVPGGGLIRLEQEKAEVPLPPLGG